MTFMLNNKVYDVLKYVAQIVLPAIGVFYMAIASIWGLPYGDQVNSTIIALDTLLGALLMLSSSSYNKLNSGEVTADDTKQEEK